MIDASVLFNSGQANQFFVSGSRIEALKINNSNESYYKDALLNIFNLSDSEEDDVTINIPAKIWIKGSLEFDGYVSRIQKSVLGIRRYTLQLIGKTYDLWRYSTSSNVTFSKKYTGYIVSSLVKEYTSITPPDVSSTYGSYVESVDLSNISVGDAVARMAKFDGSHFYVDQNNKLQYYTVSDTEQFTVTEDDIISMTPIEHSDDYLRNDVLVVGAQEYEKVEPSPLPDFVSGNWIMISSASRVVGQRFQCPTNLTNSMLTSISFRVDRTNGANIPQYLDGEIRYDNNGEPSSAIVPSSDSIIWDGTDTKHFTSGEWLPYYSFTSPNLSLSPSSNYWAIISYSGATTDRHWKVAYSELYTVSSNLSSDPGLSGSWSISAPRYGHSSSISPNVSHPYGAVGCYIKDNKFIFLGEKIGGSLYGNVIRYSGNILQSFSSTRISYHDDYYPVVRHIKDNYAMTVFNEYPLKGIYGVVLEVSGETLISGEAKLLTTDATNWEHPCLDLVHLSGNRLCMLYMDDGDRIKGIVISANTSNLTSTTGSAVTVFSQYAERISQTPAATKLSPDKVVVLIQRDNSGISGQVLTFSGMSIYTHPNYSLYSSSSFRHGSIISFSPTSATFLSNNILYNNLYINYVSISGSSISKPSSTLVDNATSPFLKTPSNYGLSLISPSSLYAVWYDDDNKKLFVSKCILGSDKTFTFSGNVSFSADDIYTLYTTGISSQSIITWADGVDGYKFRTEIPSLFDLGNLEYDSTNDRINIYGKSIGVLASGTFSDKSIVYKSFDLPSGVTSDLLEFKISCNITDYDFLSSFPQISKDKYRSRLMIGIYDPTSPNGYDYNPMVGIEFNLDRSVDNVKSFNMYYPYGIHGSGNYFIVTSYLSNTVRLYESISNTVMLISSNTTHSTAPYGKPYFKDYIYVPNHDYITIFSSTALNKITEYYENSYAYFNRVFPSGSYLFASAGYGGPKLYYFNGSTITKKWEIRTGAGTGWYWDVAKTDYAYFVDTISGLSAWSFDDSTETLSFVANTDDVGDDARSLAIDENNYIFVACLDSGLRCYTFDGSSFTLKDSVDIYAGGVSVSGDYVYVFDSNNKKIYIYKWSSQSFHYIHSYDANVGTCIHAINGKIGFTNYGNSKIYFDRYIEKGVRLFIAKDITTNDTTLPEYKFGGWCSTGSSYTLKLLSNSLDLYVDGVKEDTFDISDVILDGNYKFGAGNVYDWNKFKIQLVDGSYDIYGKSGSLSTISGNITYYEVRPLTNYPLAISDDGGNTWTKYNNRKLHYKIGWNYDYITGRKSDASSISTYGRHFYKVYEPLITTTDDANALAQKYVDTYKDGLKVGSITINGKTGIDIREKFRLSGAHINFNEKLEIASYTQSIDKNGFTTTINYGTEPFDIAAKVARLEREVYG